MLEWVEHHEALLFLLGLSSVVMFVASVLAVPYFVVRIPADYFASSRRRRRLRRHHRAATVIRVGRNLLGAVFVLVGLVMLVLPGQGILTILAGLVLLDFPGKFRLERWIVSRGHVLRTLNWMRRRAARPPLVVGAPAATAKRAPKPRAR
jgi:hypothetical protein